MAARLEQELGVVAELVVGRSGELSVWVDGTRVAEKVGSRFPDDASIIEAIRLR